MHSSRYISSSCVPLPSHAAMSLHALDDSARAETDAAAALWGRHDNKEARGGGLRCWWGGGGGAREGRTRDANGGGAAVRDLVIKRRRHSTDAPRIDEVDALPLLTLSRCG